MLTIETYTFENLYNGSCIPAKSFAVFLHFDVYS